MRQNTDSCQINHETFVVGRDTYPTLQLRPTPHQWSGVVERPLDQANKLAIVKRLNEKSEGASLFHGRFGSAVFMSGNENDARRR